MVRRRRPASVLYMTGGWKKTGSMERFSKPSAVGHDYRHLAAASMSERVQVGPGHV